METYKAIGSRKESYVGIWIDKEPYRATQCQKKPYRVIQILLMTLFFIPTWLAPVLLIYKKFIRYSSEAFDICKKHVDAAIAKVIDTDDTVIAKLVRSCGKDSPIPLIMGIDVHEGLSNRKPEDDSCNFWK